MGPRPAWWQIFLSVLAAMFGVQSEAARKRDFEQGHPGAYIIVGILMFLLFIVSLLCIVRWVLPHTP